MSHLILPNKLVLESAERTSALVSVTGLMSYSRSQRGVVQGIREAGEVSRNE